MKFWKNNRIDNEFELSFEEVLKRFKESKYYQDYLNIELPHPLVLLLINFITGKDGLSSVFEREEFDKLYDYIYKELEEVEKK